MPYTDIEQWRRGKIREKVKAILNEFPFEDYGFGIWDRQFFLSSKTFLLNKVKVLVNLYDLSGLEPGTEDYEVRKEWNDYYTDGFDPEAFAVDLANHIYRGNPTPQFELMTPKFVIEFDINDERHHAKYAPALEHVYMPEFGRKYIISAKSRGTGATAVRDARRKWKETGGKAPAEVKADGTPMPLFGDDYTGEKPEDRALREEIEEGLRREHEEELARKKRYRAWRKSRREKEESEARAKAEMAGESVEAAREDASPVELPF